jgi:hypothetical protein
VKINCLQLTASSASLSAAGNLLDKGAVQSIEIYRDVHETTTLRDLEFRSTNQKSHLDVVKQHFM